MFAVVEISGQQFKVTENTKLCVPRLNAEPNTELVFENVLLLNDDKATRIGTPSVIGAKVHAKILEHLKDDKVTVFKKKRIISYKKTRGHRQQLTRIEVTKID
jgi:large subunit ribosomal protein L21